MPLNVEGITKLILKMIGIGFCVFCYMLSIMYGLWFIKLNNTEILYRNYLGKKTVIAFSKIDSFERKTNGNAIFCGKGNKLIEVEVEHADSVIMWICDRVSITNKQKNMRSFTVRPAKYHRVLSIIILGIFAFFLLLVKYKNFLSKDVSIQYTDVDKVEIKIDDNVSYYLVYLKSADKPKLKMNTYYENVVFFKELAYKMKTLTLVT